MALLQHHTDAQMRDGFLALLPTGRAWPKDPDSNLHKLVEALIPNPTRMTARARALVADAYPRTTAELLPEWEETLGLPDPCAGIAPSTEARRNQVVARFAGTGGQSIADLQQFAANLGYPIDITEYAPTRAGLMRAGEALMGAGTQFTLRIQAPIVNQRFFTAGSAAAGDPLSSFGNSVLECEMASIVPAHSKVFHSYTGAVTVYRPGPITSVVVLQ